MSSQNENDRPQSPPLGGAPAGAASQDPRVPPNAPARPAGFRNNAAPPRPLRRRALRSKDTNAQNDGGTQTGQAGSIPAAGNPFAQRQAPPQNQPLPQANSGAGQFGQNEQAGSNDAQPAMQAGGAQNPFGFGAPNQQAGNRAMGQQPSSGFGANPQQVASPPNPQQNPQAPNQSGGFGQPAMQQTRPTTPNQGFGAPNQQAGNPYGQAGAFGSGKNPTGAQMGAQPQGMANGSANGMAQGAPQPTQQNATGKGQSLSSAQAGNQAFGQSTQNQNIPMGYSRQKQGNAQPQPYLPMQISDIEFKNGNRLSILRNPIKFETHLGRLEVMPCNVNIVPTSGQPFVGINCLFDTEPLTIWMHPGAVSAIIQKVEPKASLGDLSTTTRALVLEYALAEFLDELESKGTRISIQEVSDPVRQVSGKLAIKIKFSDLPVFVAIIECKSDLFGRFLREISELKVRRSPIKDVALPISIRAGVTFVTYDQLSELREGDAILFDHSWLEERQLAAVIAEKIIRVCGIDDDGIYITDVPPLRNANQRHLWLMETTMSDYRETDQAPDSGAIDTLEVKLVFEVGRTAVKLEDLEKMDSGYIFDLGKDAGEAVDVYAANRLIGKGELVMVQDQMGVRLTRIFR